MPRVNLAPLAKTEEGLLSYIDTNLRRITDTLGALTQIEGGIVSVTGSVDIDTGIPTVNYCLVSLYNFPDAKACFIRAFPLGGTTPRNIRINVYDNAFVQSTVAKSVEWLAVGTD